MKRVEKRGKRDLKVAQREKKSTTVGIKFYFFKKKKAIDSKYPEYLGSIIVSRRTG